MRYTDPDGHFFGALFRFVAGAVVGAVTEYVTQKFIEKRDKINVKAVIYEGVVGGVTSVIGGVGGAAKKAEKTVKAVKSAKTVVKSAIKTGAKEAAGEFLHDVGYQVFAEDKSLADVDYGQAVKAGADSGISAMVGELDDAFGSKKQLSATNRKKASQATGLIDDVADATPRPRTNTLPDVEVAPSRGAVKNAASGLADAGVGTGNVGRKSNTTTTLSKKSANAKKSSPSLSKNQQKMQSQTVGSALSGNTIEEVTKKNLTAGNNTAINKISKIDKIKGETSPKGLIGHAFEDYLTNTIGGNGSFSMGGKDFDGGIGNRFWEAKSGQYWNMLETNPKKLQIFKGDMGNRLRIANDHGATYELFSNTPIPDSIKEWLTKKGIPFTELLD